MDNKEKLEQTLSGRIVNPSATTTSVTGEGNTSFTELRNQQDKSRLYFEQFKNYMKGE